MHSEFMDMKLSDPVVNADLGDEQPEYPLGLKGRPTVAERRRLMEDEAKYLSNPQRPDESAEQYRERIGVQ